MVNPFLAVKKRTNNWDDVDRVAETLAYIKRVRAPFFVHVHLMGTHPPMDPRRRIFSKNGIENDDNLYDDAVLEFDDFVSWLVRFPAVRAQVSNESLRLNRIDSGSQQIIGDTHVKIGLVAGDGGAVIWPLLIGPHRAKELLMSGKLLDGEEAAGMGLVNHCVPREKLASEAREYAHSLAHGPQIAIRWNKMAINQTIKQSLHQILDFHLYQA